MNRMNLLWTVPIPVELPCRGGTAGSGLVAGVGMEHVHDRRPYERTGPSAVDLILRFIADGPVIWEGWRQESVPAGLRLITGDGGGFGGLHGLRLIVDDLAGGELGFELVDDLCVHLLVDLDLERRILVVVATPEV